MAAGVVQANDAMMRDLLRARSFAKARTAGPSSHSAAIKAAPPQGVACGMGASHGSASPGGASSGGPRHPTGLRAAAWAVAAGVAGFVISIAFGVAATVILDRLVPAGAMAPTDPSTAEVRAWAAGAGIPTKARGRLAPEVWAAYRRVHQH